nr:hypothetical protein [Polyangium spumosum]
MASEERRAIDNGIWLCRNCHKQIDTDEQRFTVELLRLWKLRAELAASDQLGKPKESQERRSSEHRGPLVASYNQRGGQTALQIVNNAPPARTLGGRTMPASYVSLIRLKRVDPPRVAVCSDHPETLQFGWDITEALLQLGLLDRKRGLDRLINSGIRRLTVESMASDTDEPLWYFAEWLRGEDFELDYVNRRNRNQIIIPQQ